MSNVLVGSITADTFCDTLFHSKQAVVIEFFISKMRALADVSLAMREGDSDGRNIRLMAWEVQQEHIRRCLHSFAPCMLHQSSLSTGSVVVCIQESLVSGMYAYSKLLRMGNYFIRTVFAVEVVVDDCLRVFPHPPSAECRALNESLFDFSSCHQRVARGSHQVRNNLLAMQSYGGSI